MVQTRSTSAAATDWACITWVCDLKKPVVLRPLPIYPVILDRVVDTTRSYAQYHSIKPYLIHDDPLPERERLQSPGLYAQIIDGLGHKAPYTRRGTDFEIRSLRLLHQNPPWLMMVDEVQHLLASAVRE